MFSFSLINKRSFQHQDPCDFSQFTQKVAQAYSFPDLEIFNNALQSPQSSPIKLQRTYSSISFSPVTEIDASPIEMHNSHRRYMPLKLRKERQKSNLYYNPFSASKSAETALDSSGYDADTSSGLSSLTVTPIKKQNSSAELHQKNHSVYLKRKIYLTLDCLKQDSFNERLADKDKAPGIQRHFQANLFSN